MPILPRPQGAVSTTEHVTPRQLLGTWDFARDIEDRLAGEHLAVNGTMTLTLEGEHVCWREAGVLLRHGAEIDVFRTLLIARRESGWFVTFADGRDFHPWDTTQAVTHPCGDDVYSGRITVLDPEREWHAQWEATGPAKDYTTRTRMTRPGR